MAINPAVIGGGVLVAAAAIGGGVYASGALSSSSTPGSGTGENKNIEPSNWHPLSQDTGYYSSGTTTVNQEYNTKYGATYSKYFVGVTTKNGEAGKNNNEWWEWSYNNNYKPNKKANDQSGFKNVDSKTKLIEACTNAYKAAASDIKSGNDAANAETTFAEADVWKFCSPLGQKPTTVQDTDGYSSGKIGKDHKDSLISVKDTGNDKFWKVRQKSFFAGTEPNSTSEKFFKALYDLKTTTTNELALKAKCGEAYSKTPSNTDPASENDTTAAEVKKYCYLEA